ncbi:hypothetical protein B0H63DRAFT_273999 [Podospora didyma]|uniref:Vacuolar ATPase assembly protein VMA22 n=1 Tax=Podospora didyma TaxID=330526 RepID=A0AAE0KEM6_9PEZI|nr:hypothetical protein B0H63DRAFT_273999 [Podospora didyma]
MAASGDSTIDSLLQRYLALLDEYTQLRTSLNTLQSGLYQNLARANFSAERGIRKYGQDYYDERMQAMRRVEATTNTKGAFPTFAVIRHEEEGSSFTPPPPPAPAEPAAGEDGSDEKTDSRSTESSTSEKHGKDRGGGNNNDGKPRQQPHKTKRPSSDPLRWFGFLTPMPLRLAQGQAIQAVEELIPRLASVSAEMADVEVEVRRARKKRIKANAAEEKKRRQQMEHMQTRAQEPLRGIE